MDTEFIALPPETIPKNNLIDKGCEVVIKPHYWSALPIQVPGNMVAELVETGNILATESAGQETPAWVAINPYLLRRPHQELTMLTSLFHGGEARSLLVPLIDPSKFVTYLNSNYHLLAAGKPSDLDLADVSNIEMVRHHLHFLLMNQGIERSKAGDIAHTMGNIAVSIKYNLLPILGGESPDAYITGLKSGIENFSRLLDSLQQLTDVYCFSRAELFEFALDCYAHGDPERRLIPIDTGAGDQTPHQSSLPLRLIKSAFAEVITDAEKYSLGTEIRIGWSVDQTIAVIIFEDNGIGMDEVHLKLLNAELQKLPDAIPDQGDQTGGTGLLRLRRNGFGVHLENRDPTAAQKGLRTILTLPLVKSTAQSLRD